MDEWWSRYAHGFFLRLFCPRSSDMIIALRVVIYKNGLDYLLLIDNDVTN
jgi:hypothetical protein